MKLSNDRLGRVSSLLESKQRELKDLVHTVAHDLKGPISSALLTTDLVLERDVATLRGDTRDDLGRVVRLLSRAEDMVRDLLRVFRIVWETERWGEVSLDQIVARVLDSAGPQASSRHATVSVAALPVVWGQASKLGHALSNLVENAIRHLPPAGGRVVVECEVDAGAATLCVADNGCGIPADYLVRVFDLYARVPGAREDGGSGVGLAIVKRVAEAHGGRVWVESAPGRGSRFYLRLPGVLSAPAAPPAEAGEAETLAGAPVPPR